MTFEVLPQPEVDPYRAQQLGGTAAYAAAVNELWVTHQSAEGTSAAHSVLADAAYMAGSQPSDVAARVFASARLAGGANDTFEALQAEARNAENPVQGPMVPASMLAEATATSLGFDSTAAMAAHAQFMHDQYLRIRDEDEYEVGPDGQKRKKKKQKQPWDRFDTSELSAAA